MNNLEDRLATYKKIDLELTDNVIRFRTDLAAKDDAYKVATRRYEKAKIERDELKAKLDQFQTASKTLDKILDSQFSDKIKTGLGYGNLSEKKVSFKDTEKGESSKGLSSLNWKIYATKA